MVFKYLTSQEFPEGKVTAVAVSTVSSIFLPVMELIYVSLGFVVVDFFIGVIASRVKAKRSGKLKEWGFESSKMWHTIYKVVFIAIGIVMMWVLEDRVLKFGVELRLANIFCGFVCAVEFWSFLENAAIISNHPIFRWLKKYMGKKVNEAIGVDPEDIEKASKCEDPDKDSIK